MLTNQQKHFRGLESMYLSAPINEIFKPSIVISPGEATIEINVTEKLHHAAGATHGCVYFKLLDDAAYFAANSLEGEVFVLTNSFTTYLTRPLSEGTMRSVGTVVNQNNTQFIAESIVYDKDNREVGRGNGIFVRGKKKLVDVPGYGES